MTKTLLIAEDEAGIRSLVRMTLTRADYEILEAEDGPAALALAREHRPRMILLDVGMPGMNGFEVCKALKADPATKDIVIVMLTAMAQESDQKRGVESGADGYLMKPFSPLALLKKVDETFEGLSADE
ncbi:MAG: PleD family two-component system response regulator [Actinomycetota bacterium]